MFTQLFSNNNKLKSTNTTLDQRLHFSSSTQQLLFGYLFFERRPQVRFFYSPYMRTRQTLQCILKAFEGQQVEMCAEPRLREQDFGNFQDGEQMLKVYKVHGL